MKPTRPDQRAWVLLHGTPLSPAVWADTAARLADQPVLTPDCTGVPSHLAQQTLAGRVADQIADRPVDVVGHSFGGQIAIELGLLRPRQVRSLTIVCSRDSPFPAFAELARSVRSGTVPAVEATLNRWFTADEVSTNGPAVQQARIGLQEASPVDWAAALDAIASYDRQSSMARLTMPVRLIAAGGDSVSTPAAMQAMATRLPHVNLIVRSAWMHMSPFTDPGGLAALIDNRSESDS
jgi:pimeloyl-ACP methyl ester carboxylesterase